MRDRNFDENLTTLLEKVKEIAHSKDGYSFVFSSRADADSLLNFFHENSISATINENNKINPPSYQVNLSSPDFSSLREAIRRESKRIGPTGDFVFKSIRTDERSYFRQFMPTVVPTDNQKLPTPRLGEKKSFTTTGKGIFKRPTFAEDLEAADIKKPQYTPQEKAGFSNFQSATQALTDFQPRVFGHASRGEKLVGVIFEEEDVLYSDRLYIYDGGTVRRPYDFHSYKEAIAYYEKLAGTKLFTKEQLKEFKKAIKDPKNADNYNETLVRLRWNIQRSKIFITSDNLETRLWAQEYARMMSAYLKQRGLCPHDYVVPICFYVPSNKCSLLVLPSIPNVSEISKILGKSDAAYIIVENKFYYIDKSGNAPIKLNNVNLDDLEQALDLPESFTLSVNKIKHLVSALTPEQLKIITDMSHHRYSSPINFKEYTQAEQMIDNLEAKTFFSDQENLKAQLQANNFEYLLTLDFPSLLNVLQIRFNGQTVLTNLLTKGYIHVFQSLLEKHASDNSKLMELLDKEIKKHENINFIPQIIYHCYRADAKELASFVIEQSQFDRLPLKIPAYADNHPLLLAAELNLPECINALLKNKNFSIWYQDKKGNWPLVIAAQFGSVQAVSALLQAMNIYLNDKYYAKELQKIIYYSLLAAADNGNTEVVREIINYAKKSNIALLGLGKVLFRACEHGAAPIAKELLKQDRNILYYEHELKQDEIKEKTPIWEFSVNALHIASMKGHIEVVRELLTNEVDPNSISALKVTALMLAARYGQTTVVKELLAHKDIDPNFYTQRGKSSISAIQEAVEHKHNDIIYELLNHRKMIIDFNNPLHLKAFTILLKDRQYSQDTYVLLQKHLASFLDQLESAEMLSTNQSKSIFSRQKQLSLSAIQFLVKNWNRLSAIETSEDFKRHEKEVSQDPLKQIYFLLKHYAPKDTLDSSPTISSGKKVSAR